MRVLLRVCVCMLLFLRCVTLLIVTLVFFIGICPDVRVALVPAELDSFGCGRDCACKIGVGGWVGGRVGGWVGGWVGR
jgi:hypothetical protein